MSELKDLKVGDLVSVKLHDRPNWSCYPTITEDQCREIQNHPDWLEWQHGIHSSLIPEGFAIVPIEPDFNMVRAACESKAVCDEGEHVSLSEYLDFSGENRTHIVVRQALRDAINAAPKPTDK